MIESNTKIDKNIMTIGAEIINVPASIEYEDWSKADHKRLFEFARSLQSENEQLKARVAELGEHVKRERQGNLNLIEFDVVPIGYHDSIMREVEIANAILDRAPNQSLNDLKADAIEEIAKKWNADAELVDVGRSDLKSAASALYFEANQLRQQSKE